MTNETDLRECSAQIELVKLLLGPETFDLDKILIKLETKKKLLMAFKPRSYHNILKDLDSGTIIHPGDWVKPPKKIEEKKVIKKPEEPKIDKKTIALEKELQETKNKLAELKALKELKKEEEAEVTEEIGE